MICYAGPFISQYREQMETLWRDQMKDLFIKYTDKINMRSVLGKDVVIR